MPAAHVLNSDVQNPGKDGHGLRVANPGNEGGGGDRGLPRALWPDSSQLVSRIK